MPASSEFGNSSLPTKGYRSRRFNTRPSLKPGVLKRLEAETVCNVLRIAWMANFTLEIF